MLSSLICLLSIAVLVQETRSAPEETAHQIDVRLRTVDINGRRLADCAIYFVQSDAPRLRPAPRPSPLLFRSNAEGKLFAKLPAGHAWKVFAHMQGPKGPLATGLLDLAQRDELRDLVLEQAPVRRVELKGLALWRKALPTGLGLRVAHEDLLLLDPVLPTAGSEEIEMPPMPRGDFSISLEHERYGTVARIDLEFGPWVHPLLRHVPSEGSIALELGQPVKVEGRVLGTVDEAIAGASIRMLLPRARKALSQRAIRSDAQGRFQLWFAWKRKEAWRPTTPKLLITAPGHLLRLHSLDDLCDWISLKTESDIDPDTLVGLDMACNRVIRLERAHRLEWTVKGGRPSDRFFMKVRLPVGEKKRAQAIEYLLPVAIDANGALELPGDSMVLDARGKLRRILRFQKHTRGMDLYLLRGGFSDQLFNLKRGEALPPKKTFDLRGGRSVLVRVFAKGSPVSDARVQLARVGAWNPILSAPRRMSNAGSLRLQLGNCDYWIFVQSDRRGQAYRKLDSNAQDPEGITIELEAFRSVRILTAHPIPGFARFPIRFSISTYFNSEVPNPVQYMIRYAEAQRGPRILHHLKEKIVVQVSPWARALSAQFRLPASQRRRGFPNSARGSLKLDRQTVGDLELEWR